MLIVFGFEFDIVVCCQNLLSIFQGISNDNFMFAKKVSKFSKITIELHFL